MKIEFTKDQEDIRPNRDKIIQKGTILTVQPELGNQYIEMGVAIRVDIPQAEQPNATKLKKLRPKSGSWWSKQSDTMKVGLLTILATIFLFILARVLDKPDRYTIQTEVNKSQSNASGINEQLSSIAEEINAENINFHPDSSQLTINVMNSQLIERLLKIPSSEQPDSVYLVALGLGQRLNELLNEESKYDNLYLSFQTNEQQNYYFNYCLRNCE